MKTLGFLGFCILLLTLWAIPPSEAAIKVIVFVGRPSFAGATLVVPLEVRPFTQDVLTFERAVSRLTTNASTTLAGIKQLIKNIVAGEPYNTTVTDEEIWVIGAPE